MNHLAGVLPFSNQLSSRRTDVDILSINRIKSESDITLSPVNRSLFQLNQSVGCRPLNGLKVTRTDYFAIKWKITFCTKRSVMADNRHHGQQAFKLTNKTNAHTEIHLNQPNWHFLHQYPQNLH